MKKAPLKKQIQKKVSSFVGTVVEATAPNNGLNKILPFEFLIFFKFGKRQNFVKPQPLCASLKKKKAHALKMFLKNFILK